MDDIYSPNGKYYITTNMTEMRMSHWVYEPFLMALNQEKSLFDLNNTGWSVDKTTWSDDSASVTLDLRRYPGTRPPVELVLYPSENRAVVVYFEEKVLETDGMGRAMRVSYHKNGSVFEGTLAEVQQRLCKG
ncbi:MAG: hypothetical protein IT270_18905 [Saprospiraceae bacterium]|nr:hypothetical protein [Saprospiraceae bacterium]